MSVASLFKLVSCASTLSKQLRKKNESWHSVVQIRTFTRRQLGGLTDTRAASFVRNDMANYLAGNDSMFKYFDIDDKVVLTHNCIEKCVDSETLVMAERKTYFAIQYPLKARGSVSQMMAQYRADSSSLRRNFEKLRLGQTSCN